MTEKFVPNNPLPEFQVPCAHNRVRSEVDFSGASEGYDVCLECGARQYYVHHDLR